ncbi:MAG TPA: hypothetical protein VJA23_00565 [Candidatus Nanoarchaeia archaeon]|nr:hypothetical protein [Candidatus Nanoarchaeia archaeon]
MPAKKKGKKVVLKKKLSPSKKKVTKTTAKVVKRSKVKTPIRKAELKKVPVKKGKIVGKITHFYDEISVGVVALSNALKQGDRIQIGKREPYVEQEVKSMQLDHEKIALAKKGQEIGLKVKGKVRDGDLVYKL